MNYVILFPLICTVLEPIIDDWLSNYGNPSNSSELCALQSCCYSLFYHVFVPSFRSSFHIHFISFLLFTFCSCIFFYNLVYVHCFCLCAFHTCFQVLIIWYLLNEERGHFWKGKKGGPWFLVNHILSFDPDGECQALKCGSICHIFQGVLSS